MDDNDDDLSSSLNGIAMLPLQMTSSFVNRHQQQHHQHDNAHDIMLITNNTNTNISIQSEDDNDNNDHSGSFSNYNGHTNSLSISNHKTVPYFHRSFPSIQTLDMQWETIETSLKLKDKCKNVSSSHNEEFYSTTNQNSSINNNINNNFNGNNSISTSFKEFNFKHILHPIDHDFEDFVKMKIDSLEKMKIKGESSYSKYKDSECTYKDNNNNRNTGVTLTMANIYDLTDYDNSGVIIKPKRNNNNN